MKGVIFDLDGTLVDTLEDITAAINYAMKECNLPLHTIQEVKCMIGNGMKRLVKDAVGEYQEKFDKALSLYSSYYAEHLVVKSKPYVGIETMLDYFVKNNIPMAVLSNKPDKDAKEVVKRVFPNINFDVVCGGREDVPVKPDIKAGLYVSQCMGVPIEELVMIGDGTTDIKFAQNSNMKCIAVSWGFKDVDALVMSGANVIANSPDEIIKYYRDYCEEK